MALRPLREPLADVPDRLTDGSRLVGVVSGGTPVYHDADDAAFRDAAGQHGGTESTDDQCRLALGPDESVADGITTVEHRSGWAILSEYGLEHLSDA